ncbi:hypothetical protein A4D02_23700 [Niastella koreensis]|uniref:Uncharacterized protein n=2 Tax=Niastella koreensis TaxID=354356 RepID=G8TC29_NIAKG|nr:hypothetical protein [Niastella koreensis]AEW00336.1 hypothetical protein Niako_4057 [Niastella koreensis GR20-10]OQP52202.1 hypothetical protein A4D02_23700 [Niastella koreensis]
MLKLHIVFALPALLLTATPFYSHAQSTVDQVGNTADRVNNTIDKVGGLFKKKNRNKSTDSDAAKPTTTGNSVTINTVYDFVPGNNLLFIDHFDSTKKGNFPIKWLTNASGEVVTLQQYPGNWFSITSNGFYIPKIKGGLPKDFTVEFDLIIDGSGGNTLYVDFEDALDHNFDRYPSNPYLGFRIYSDGNAYVTNKAKELDTHVSSSAYNAGAKINHMAFKKEGERLRVYINQEKTYDINHAFESNRTYSTFKFGGDFYSPTHMLISNVTIAGL